jgi:hypothetical protein
MSLVQSDPDVLLGTPVFQGTKVPAEALFDYLEAGETIESFLRDFPNVTRDTAVMCLRESGKTLISHEPGDR